jgi:hypothetical protein
MDHFIKVFLSILLSFFFAVLPDIASASHHFETPMARMYPAFDLTDLYVFESTRPGYTVLIINMNPKTDADRTPDFSEQGLYNIHIAFDPSLSEGMTLTARASGNRLVLGLLDSANPELGAEGEKIGEAPYVTDTTLKNGIRVWTGASRDLFVGNAAGIKQFRNRLDEGVFDPGAYDNAQDYFSQLNSSTLVLEVPNKMLPEKIYVYASTALKKEGEWIQVNRLANVLMTHLLMYNNKPEQSEHVHHRPDIDHEQIYAIASTVLRAVSLAGSQKNPVAYADQVAKRMLPDLMPYQVGTKASYGVERINGRATTDDAMDVMLSIFSGKAMTDHANTFDRHPQEFPYVVPLK